MRALKEISLAPVAESEQGAVKAGFRVGALGTHTSRTMMLAELGAALAAAGPAARRAEYAAAIIEGNCLGKPTASTRRLSNQRLGELYGLDPGVPLFRVLRRLWAVEEAGRPLLALLVSLARDPLLRATAPVIMGLAVGAELQRREVKAAVRASAENRLNEATLDKVVRNTGSSWTQSGHLEGRTFKIRRLVQATPAAVALALYLGHAAGWRGEELLASGWVAVLDCSVSSARDVAVDAKRFGLIDLRMAGDVIEVGVERLDPAAGRS